MPAPKRKATGLAADYRKQKTARTTKKYGGTGKKYANKYGGSDALDLAMMKLADAAVLKNIGKSIETQKSEAVIKMQHQGKPSPDFYSGFNLVGLNQNWDQAFNTDGTPAKDAAGNFVYNEVQSYDQMLAFNLSAMSQVKGTQGGSISGWRQGHKINALSFTITLCGEIEDISGDSEYHLLLARRKDGARAGDYQNPTIVTADTMNLFKQLSDGPFATSNYGDTSSTPSRHYLSMMSRNTDAWSFVEKGHMTRKVTASPQGNGITANASVNMTMYHSFGPGGTVWDFTSQTATTPVLKNGDYYVFVWREGASDTQMEQNLKLYIKLSYKDG